MSKPRHSLVQRLKVWLRLRENEYDTGSPGPERPMTGIGPNAKIKAMYADYLDVQRAKAARADYEANGGVPLDDLKAELKK
jgi:hypothetical protein